MASDFLRWDLVVDKLQLGCSPLARLLTAAQTSDRLLEGVAASCIRSAMPCQPCAPASSLSSPACSPNWPARVVTSASVSPSPRTAVVSSSVDSDITEIYLP
jgi:hypothetical protein